VLYGAPTIVQYIPKINPLLEQGQKKNIQNAKLKCAIQSPYWEHHTNTVFDPLSSSELP